MHKYTVLGIWMWLLYFCMVAFLIKHSHDDDQINEMKAEIGDERTWAFTRFRSGLTYTGDGKISIW